MANTPKRNVTHRELCPPDMCPSLMMKQILTSAMDEIVWDDRTHPGDGYYWCLETCKDVGPDDDLVAPEKCVSSRRCHCGVQS